MKKGMTKWLAMATLGLALSLPASAQLGQNLVIYYDFEETAGSVLNDTSGSTNDNDASVVGNDMSVATATGKIGNAYRSPNDSTNYAVIDTTPNNAREAAAVADTQWGDKASGTDFSYAFWINYPTDTGAVGTRPVGNIDFSLGTTARDGAAVLIDGGGNPQFRLNTNGVAGLSINGGNPPANTWYHYVCTVDRDGLMRVYTNGVLNGTADASTLLGSIGSATLPWTLGVNANPGGGQPTGDEIIDDFGMWHRVLSPNEVTRIYNLGNASTPVGILAGSTTPWLTATVPSTLSWQHIDSLVPNQVTVVLNNPGTVNAQVSSLSINKGAFTSDALTITAPATPFTVNAGTSTTFTVNWTPAAQVGNRSFTLTINSDDPTLATNYTIRGAVYPDTLARYKFDNGTAGADMVGSAASTIYRMGAEDLTGNGNHLLDFWDAGNSNSVAFSSNIPPVVPGTNVLSVDTIGAGFPALFTWNEASTGTVLLDIEDAVLRNWTLEAFIFPTTITGSNRGIIGRDGNRPGADQASPLYFNIQANGQLHCAYHDQGMVTHFAQASVACTTNRWYYVAAVVNQDTGSTPTLTLYRADLTAGETVPTQVAQTFLNSSSNRDFGPWPRGAATSSDDDAWTLFRQMWNNGHVDRFIGNIDEVRISGTALDIPTEGLMAVGVPVELSAFELE